MKYYLNNLTFLFILTLLAACGDDDEGGNPDENDSIIPETGYETPESYDGYDLVWQDEFDGTDINQNDWTFEIGNGVNGWGNSELQYYTEENASILEGHLVIEAKREALDQSPYTSSRMITKEKQEFQYGRIDIRAVLPTGQGVWPALWMLGDNIDVVGWPRCGEIDIVEYFGRGEGNNSVEATVHWHDPALEGSGNPLGRANYGLGYTLPEGDLDDEFHVYSLVWTDSQVQALVDDNSYFIIDTTPEELAEFRNEFFLIFNVAVGGTAVGDPASTVFPKRMIVDYVRVFQLEGQENPEPTESELDVDFEGNNPMLVTFGGNEASVVSNPDASGINTSANVMESIHGNEPWGGQYFDLEEPLNLTIKSKVSLKVWAPDAGFNFRFKIESIANSDDFHEYDLPISADNEWVELVFDLTSDNAGAAAASDTYARIVLFPGWDVANAGTFYVDDIKQVE